MRKVKLVGVKVKRPARKADAPERNMPETKAMIAFEKKYKAANKVFGDGHWQVYFWPQDMHVRTIMAFVQGPLNFSEPCGPQSVEESKKRLKRYNGLYNEFEQAIAYAEKKQKELEKEFKALPTEVEK